MAKPKVVRSYLLPLPRSEMKKTFPNLRIKVCVFDNGTGTIESNLKNKVPKQDSQEQLWNSAFNMQMDAIESLLLGLAVAGVDLDSPEFMAGMVSALEAIASHD